MGERDGAGSDEDGLLDIGLHHADEEEEDAEQTGQDTHFRRAAQRRAGAAEESRRFILWRGRGQSCGIEYRGRDRRESSRSVAVMLVSVVMNWPATAAAGRGCDWLRRSELNILQGCCQQHDLPPLHYTTTTTNHTPGRPLIFSTLNHPSSYPRPISTLLAIHHERSHLPQR